MNDASIVLASLDDQKLKDSISSLVKNVNEGMDAILKKTNSTVSQMENRLRSLGKLDIGGSADGGSSNRTRKLKEEKAQIDANTEATKKKTQAEKELTLTLDQQAQARQKAARMPSEMRMDAPKSARDSFYVFQSTLTQRSRELVTEIKNAEAAFNTALDIKLQGKQLEWQRKLEQTRQKLEQFRENLGDTRTVQQMREEQRLVNLMSQQQAMLDKIRGQRSQMLQPIMALHAEETKVLSAMHDVEQGQNKVTQSTQQTTQAAQQYTEEIRKQAEEIRKSKQWKETKTYQWTDDKGVTYRVMEGKKLGTVEEQLLAIRNRNLQVEQLQKEIEDSRVVTAQKYASSVREHVANAEKYFEEVKKIKDVQDKTKMNIGSFYGADVTASSQPTAKYVYEINDARAHGLSIEQQVINILQQHYESERRILELKKEQANVASGTKSQAQTQDVNYLKQQLSSLLNIEEREVAMVNVKEASYKQLSTYLAQLQKAYQKLGGDIAKAEGSDIANEIQRVQRAMATLQTQMKRPVSLGAALGIKTNTLDDIQYKIRQLQSYKQGIDLFKPNAQNEIKQVDEAINKLQKDMNKYMNTSKSVIEQNNALGRSWNYMKNRLAFYFTVGAVTQFVKSLVEVRSQYEMNERALGILIGSAEYGTKVFNELSQMSLISPYTLIELSAAAKQLTAYGVAARDVVDTTRRLADMASAVGVPMERLTYALGQIQAYGYLNNRDQRMFANAGIPLAAELAKYYTEIEGKLVSTGDVYDRIKKKAVDYNDVMQVVYRMTDEGGQFFDFQAKMADTLKVRIANLTLAWNNMLNDIGKSEQGFLTWSIGALRELFLRWRDIDRAVNTLAITFGIAKGAQLLYYTAIRGSMLFTQRFAAHAIALEKVLGVRLAGAIKAVGKSLTTVMASPLTWWAMLAFAVVGAGMAFYEANQKVKEFNNSIKEGAKENYNNIVEYMKMSQSLRNSLYDTSESAKKQANGGNLPTRDIDKSEAEKAWEEMRNQIEISTNASKEFLGTLISIEDVNERLRVGFALLDDIQKANAALKEMDEKSLSISQDKSGWWNFYLLPDGLIQNVKDYQAAIEGAEFSWERFFQGFWRQANIIGTAYNIFSAGASDTEAHYKRMKADIDEATNSLEMFLYNQNLLSNPAAISEGYAQLVNKLSVGLNPQEAFELQKAVEESRASVMRQALNDRIADENAALAQARDENAKKDIQSRLNVLQEQKAMFAQELDHSRPYWDNYTKFLKERYMSEMQQMFGNMTQEEIRHINFSEGKYAEFVKKTADNFVKSHKMSYLEAFTYLRQWVLNANAWSVFIPITFGTGTQKSYYDELTDWDTKADASYNKQKRLREDINRLEKEGKKNTEEHTKATQEETQAQKDYNEAVAHGGKSRAAEADSKKGAAASRKSAADAKKRAREAAKAQREAETELQKTLKNELSLIDKVRSSYKTLTDAGVDRISAITQATSGYGKTVASINKVFAKWGIEKLDLSKFVGISNPRELVELLKKQLNKILSTGRAKQSEIKDLQVKVQELDVEAQTYDLKKITEGLNNELNKLKEEYELSLSLDADPELGNLFTDIFGIDTTDFPKTLHEMIAMAQDAVTHAIMDAAQVNDKGMLGDFDIVKGDLNKWAETYNIDITSSLYNQLQTSQKLIRDIIKKDFDETSKAWDKLLEKYSEYEYKQTKISKDANQERLNLVKKFGTQEQIEKATKLVTKIDAEQDPERKEELREELRNLISNITEDNELVLKVSLAIDEKELQDQAKLSFDEFQKTPEWIVATGDLADMSKKAIGSLINQIEGYRRSAKNLSPKQIKEINKALKNLYKEQRKNNPFASIGNMLDEAKDRMAVYDEEIAKVEKQIEDATDAMETFIDVNGDGAEEQKTKLDKLIEKWEKLKKDQRDAGKIDASAWVGAINETIGAVKSAIGVLNDLKKSIGGVEENDLDKVFGVLESAGQGAAIGAQIGGGYGAIIGGAIGAATSLIKIFATASDERITDQIKNSERLVKRLENTYKNLEHAADDAYGAQVSGAKRALRASKELQLAEAQRQLQLEKSRKSKNQDKDKIIELEGQIIDLKNEINDTTKDIVNDLLGISSAGDGIESMVSAMINAFRNGEDVMKAFGDSFDEMVDNMILKLVVTQFMQKAWDNVLKKMQDKEEEMLKESSEAQAEARQKVDVLSEMSDDEVRKIIANERYGFIFGYKVSQEEIDAYRKAAEAALTNSTEELNKASLDYTKWSLDYMNTEGRDYLTQYATLLKDSLGNWYKYGENKELQLSNLQQGIQGITEDTAGALEAITNGISQQCYLQSDILIQIRDTVQSFDIDIQTASLSQILLQLQSSYQLQQSMLSTMEGWSNASGNAVKVELIS